MGGGRIQLILEAIRGETRLIALKAGKVQVTILTEEGDPAHNLVKDKEKGVVQWIHLIQITKEKPHLIQRVCMDSSQMAAFLMEPLF